MDLLPGDSMHKLYALFFKFICWCIFFLQLKLLDKSNSKKSIFHLGCLSSCRTVPPVSRHWSCQSGKSNIRARIGGDVYAGIRLRPVSSMHLERKKGSPRCAVMLLFRKFIKTVPNILETRPRHVHQEI